MPVKRKTNEVQVVAKSFVDTDDTAKLFAGQAGKLKARLMLLVQQLGDLDENGHQTLELPEHIVSRTTSGKGESREEIVIGFKREKHKSRFIDPEKAEAWLKKNKLWKECTEEVVVHEIQEDKLWKLVFDGRFSEDEINALYGENVSFALVRVKE
jgi:hypothetical protein